MCAKELEELEKFRFYEFSPEEKEKALEKVREVLERHDEVLLGVVHGSFLGGASFRDVDVAIYIVGNVDPLDCEFRLEKELRGALGLPVDVRLLNEAPPWFTAKVLREGKTLVGRIPGLSERLYLKSIDERRL